MIIGFLLAYKSETDVSSRNNKYHTNLVFFNFSGLQNGWIKLKMTG
jgi:hypothetical protein